MRIWAIWEEVQHAFRRRELTLEELGGIFASTGQVVVCHQAPQKGVAATELVHNATRIVYTFVSSDKCGFIETCEVRRPYRTILRIDFVNGTVAAIWRAGSRIRSSPRLSSRESITLDAFIERVRQYAQATC